LIKISIIEASSGLKDIGTPFDQNFACHTRRLFTHDWHISLFQRLLSNMGTIVPDALSG
jgi:hypothetical protein